MTTSHRFHWTLVGMGLSFAILGCNTAQEEGTTSEVAVSAVSGALNNFPGTGGLAMRVQPEPSALDTVLSALNPLGVAWAAAEFSCTPGTLDQPFAPPSPLIYVYTPGQCSFTGPDGLLLSSSWSTTFTLNYETTPGSTSSLCDPSQGPTMESQSAGCTLTRTTAPGGNTRDLVGAKSGRYAIVHDTNGAGSGWDSSVSPAPLSTGVTVVCGGNGCASSRTLQFNGSHLTGTLSPTGSSPQNIWDHTLTTSLNLLQVTGSGASRSVSGMVTVQHNLSKYTAEVNFNNVTYTDAACCFPTGGSVTANVINGKNQGQTETLTFNGACGSATLKDLGGSTSTFIMHHCL
jgi:hypothetical protein